VGTVLDGSEQRRAALTFDDIRAQAMRCLPLTVEKVNWFSTYRVHHRVASQFRVGPAFLLGDAGHVHSPAGAQGMNTGIGDAFNLAWKLAAVLRNGAGDALLDSYASERIGFARRLVSTTDSVFTLATADRPLARFGRTTVVPLLVRLLNHLPPVRGFAVRTVAQLALQYRGSVLSAGRAGRVHGGDRLPWFSAGTGDNHAALGDMQWHVHLVGTAQPGLRDWCADKGIALDVFAWSAAARRAGFARDAAYLIRPDTYVALAVPSGAPAPLARYFSSNAMMWSST
jgi:hypothetical protein